MNRRSGGARTCGVASIDCTETRLLSGPNAYRLITLFCLRIAHACRRRCGTGHPKCRLSRRREITGYQSQGLLSTRYGRSRSPAVCPVGKESRQFAQWRDRPVAGHAELNSVRSRHQGQRLSAFSTGCGFAAINCCSIRMARRRSSSLKRNARVMREVVRLMFD
jgi:hypothetical protein